MNTRQPPPRKKERRVRRSTTVRRNTSVRRKTSVIARWFSPAAATVAAGVMLSSPALAQDPGTVSAKKEPNVLLIVDTSGSMEYKTGEASFPVCDPTGGVSSERSRWIEVVEVLTGSIDDYRCDALNRQSGSFASEFELPGGINPIDSGYRNPYHRPLSGTCTIGPDNAALSALTNAFDWAQPARYVYSNPATACASFTQQADGLIDSLNDSMRFGLMTFDTLPDDGQGHDPSYAKDFATGVRGAWSYFLGSAKQGHPPACEAQTIEVGVRNGSAPAWEGKLINFGDPDASLSENQTRHSRVQEVLLSTRPYGATPIAGALHDARDFLLNDSRLDPLDPSRTYGPYPTDPTLGDPYVAGGCREQHIILLTDGEPNLDLRPHCEGGACPYDESTSIVASLASSAYPVKTHVVGFVDDVTTSGVDCNAMTTADWGPGGVCETNTADKELQICCRLHEVAYEGDTERALLAADKTALRSQLSSILGSLIGGPSSGTQPVRSPGRGAADQFAVAYRFLTSYEVKPDGLWNGVIERQRWTCNTSTLPEPVSKEQHNGDDFSFNLNSNPTDRTFVTFVPEEISGMLHPDRSIRPNIEGGNGARDGLGSVGGSQTSAAPAAFVSNLDARMIKADTSVGAACAGMTEAECRDTILTWAVGLDNGTGVHRCPTPGGADCSVLGDVMHSTPVVVNRPSAALDDETYALYAANHAGRPMALYTSSNDGQLHGFFVSPNDAADSPLSDTSRSGELFSFMPPAVLPLQQSQYPTSRQKLLDGVPVVQEVVAAEHSTNTHYPFKLERSQAGAINASATETWRTILVQSFGGARGGYFALDITEPEVPSSGNTGPRFLWQLTTDGAGNPLFGEGGGTPIITTLDVDGVETAVAVLPGGAGPTVAGTCDRADPGPFPDIAMSYTPRSKVRCYALDKTNDGVTGDDDLTYIGARSLTIVRLDSGEIIRTFRRHPDEAPTLAAATSSPYAGANGLFGDADKLPQLDSPITGAPAAFPGDTGAVADRIFVGDQDGSLWRVDVSNPDPARWDMKLFFDAFAVHPQSADPVAAAEAGRPIATRPVLSFDDFGQINLAFSTGDQDLSGSPGEFQYVWSLTEQLKDDGTGFQATVNWSQELENGEHVLGDIELLDGTLYFSTYAPPTGSGSSLCEQGVSSVWGLNYRVAENVSDPSLGGAAGLRLAGSTDFVHSQTAEDLNLEDGTLIFGVGLEFAPTCFSEESIPDALLGSRTAVSNPSPPQLQLTFHTGEISTGSQADVLDFKTGFEAVNLAPPQNSATIESWAAILE